MTHDEARSFVGKNAEFYLGKWKEYEDGAFKGWNWAACFFRAEWLVYRKMYLEAALLLVGVMALGVLMGAVQVYSGFAMGRWWDSFGKGVIQCSMGFFGNMLYWRKARRVVAGAPLQPGPRLRYLQEKGGTSPLAVILVVMAEVFIVFAL